MSTILQSTLHSAAGRELGRLLSKDSLVLTGAADLIAYSYDATGGHILPEAVVLPASTADTALAVKWAAQNGVPVVVRGAGTNLSGGTVPLAGGLVIGMSRINQVRSVDTLARRAVVGPGVTNLALQEFLAPLGFAFAPDPASQKVSTLGGNAGENAGGPHCLKYGVTVDHIVGLTAVLADGEVVRCGYEDAPGGHSLTAASALVGSEGTLALITEIVVRLEPLPPAVKTMLAVYDRLEDAGRSVSDIIARRLLPATLELMDRTTLNTVEESFHLGYPTDAEGALIIEVDGLAPGLARQVQTIEEICRANGARSVAAAQDETERAKLWLGRRSAFGALARRSPIYSVQDVTVPRDRLVEMMRHVGDVMERHQLEVAVVAHAGDGNLHPIVLYREATPERLARVHAANHELLQLAVDMDGTISGEHGVGSEKLEFLSMAVPPAAVALMGRVKREFDRAGLLNPGKAVLPLPADSAETNLPPVLADDPSAAAVTAVRRAAAAGGRLRPAGACSRLSWAGGDSEALLPLSALRGVVDLDEPNLTVTVLAGTPSRELSAAVSQAGFWLPPLDHCFTGSVGGDVATGWLSPTGAQLGPIQRWMLGAEMVLGNGEQVKLGGSTMKNVAGYNLLHLLAGSFGRLGAITQLRFRLWPRPQSDLTLACTLDDWLATAIAQDVAGCLDPLVRATRPVALSAVSGRDGRPPQVLVRLAGLDEDIAWAANQWRDRTPMTQLAPEDTAQAWQGWTTPLTAARSEGRLEYLRSPVAAGHAMLQSLQVGGGDWSLCLISGSGLRAGPYRHTTVPAGAAVFGRAGGTADDFAGPLDSRLIRAFDPAGVFGWTGGGAR